jgi:hypothetical protein
LNLAAFTLGSDGAKQSPNAELGIKIPGASSEALAKPLAGEVARAPAVHPWSHGDRAVVFSSSRPETFDQLTIGDKLPGYLTQRE